jgi:hypothetical protein
LTQEAEEAEEINFAELLGTGRGNGTVGRGGSTQEEEELAIREVESRFVELRDAITGQQTASARSDRQWKPPTDLRPTNRKQIVAPELETSFGDIVISPNQTFPTFSLATIPDDSIRLSSTYPETILDTHVLFLLAPSGYEQRRKYSYETRWENLNTRLNSVQKETLRSYERLVTRWLRFCEEEGIEPKDRFPANPQDVNNWVGSYARKYSAGYLRSHFNAIEFWHELHDLEFSMDTKIKNRTLNGAKRLGPPARPLRRGLTTDDLLVIVDSLDDEATRNPKRRAVNLAIKAATLFSFFAMARLKDAALDRRASKKRTSKKNKQIITGYQKLNLPPLEVEQDVTFTTGYDVHGSCFEFHPATDDMPAVYSIRIPWDKMKHEKGETVHLAEQLAIDPKLCPVRAIKEHLEVNKPGDEEPGFCYYGDKGQRIWLTKKCLTDRVNEALVLDGRDRIHGHSFREGGATFYTKAGVDPEITRACGRWAGKSNFQIYLREKEKIAGQHLANLTNEPKRRSNRRRTASKVPEFEVTTDEEDDEEEYEESDNGDED